MNAKTLAFDVTFFPDHAAMSKKAARYTLRVLAELIQNTSAIRKDALPWLKLARFGDRLSPKGSLRHDANVIAVAGLEADYDGAEMTFEEAHDVLEKQGLAALLYTSPSHAEDTPRWRVLCPLSEEMAPDRRAVFLGRLNGLFRGIFAGESWTLSQAYYFGSVNRNPSHRVEVVEGETIDQHDDLDVIWLGKPGGPSGTTLVGQEAREDAELIRCVVTGEHLHVELVALAARYTGRGIPAETTAELLRGLMLSHPESARDERWLDRYNDIDRTVDSAVKKFRGDAGNFDPRRTETARLAFRLMRCGMASADILATLHAHNRGRPEPLPDDVIGATAIWATRNAQELARAR